MFRTLRNVCYICMVLVLSLSFAQELTDDALLHSSYQGIYDAPIKLMNGFYEGDPFTPDSPARPRVELTDRLIARGDLNGDGADEAAVLLSETGGGTGNFVFVAVVTLQDGEAVNVATEMLGDRVQVRSMKIENGQLVLELVVAGEGDAACCPRENMTKTLALEGDTLTTVSEEATGKISVADIEGMTWYLRELAEGQPILEGSEITLTLAEGVISGSAGCNNYQAGYTPGEGDLSSDLAIQPPLSTLKACEPLVMAQEQEFLAKLEQVTRFSYLAGDMVLSYVVNDVYGMLIFSREP